MIDDPTIDNNAAETVEEAARADEHPLSSPTEFAGTAGAAIEAEFAARDAAAAADLLADADGSASGVMLEEDPAALKQRSDDLPLDAE